jgi:DNA-binding NarL/FixJ family response regulator
MTRILVADDHEIVRSGLVQLLAQHAGIHVAAEASSAEEVLLCARSTALDLVLLDLNMPGKSGVPLIENLRRARPALPILVLSMHNEGQIVSRALRAGAAGYVTKASGMAVLLEAIACVAAGGRYIDPALVQNVVFDAEPGARPLHETLSARERQVLALIVSGLRLGDIADRLHVSAKTVSTHKMRLMHKLRVDNNADLVRYALDHPLLAQAATSAKERPA